jgi:hypothetical protein
MPHRGYLSVSRGRGRGSSCRAARSRGYLATSEREKFFTSPLSPLPTQEAARTQHWPAVDADAGSPSTRSWHGLRAAAKQDRGISYSPAAQADTRPPEVGGPLESLRGEAPWRTMGQMSPTSARAPKGKTPVGKAPMRPPDLPDPQTQGSAVQEPESINPKVPVRAAQARKPIFDKDARTHRDSSPSLGIADICSGSASLHKGE